VQSGEGKTMTKTCIRCNSNVSSTGLHAHTPQPNKHQQKLVHNSTVMIMIYFWSFRKTLQKCSTLPVPVEQQGLLGHIPISVRNTLVCTVETRCDTRGTTYFILSILSWIYSLLRKYLNVNNLVVPRWRAITLFTWDRNVFVFQIVWPKILINWVDESEKIVLWKLKLLTIFGCRYW